MDKETKIYETEDIIVFWKPSICQHAGKCVKGNPKVFDVERRPWIKLNEGTIDSITTAIDQCPSGALSYKRK